MNPVESYLSVTRRLLRHVRSRTGWIVGSYAVFSTLWIFFSDQLLGRLMDDPEKLVRWSVYKGFAFVGVTSGLLLLLLRRAFGTMETGYVLLQTQETEIRRLNRLNAALGHINQAIMRLPVRAELFRRICQVLVEHGGFRLAWIGWHNPATRQLEPVAVAGDENDYIKNMKVYADERPEGLGPSGRAFRSNQPCVCNDVAGDPVVRPWRMELQRRGFHASVAIPIRNGDQVGGVLNVYADEPGFFQDKELALLTEATTDIAFALDNLCREEERRLAQARAQNEKLFSDTMIESMPGIVYFYDAQRRFLRWNRNFETVSGYARDEVARMHPLDFFAPEHRPLLEQRIAQVFEKGEAWVEAPFQSKDGRATPYFFTGRRVVLDGITCLAGVGIDISERRQAEDRKAESERKYRELVEHANSIILRWNSEGRITLLNEFGQRFFGYSAEEIIGRHVIGTIVPYTESGGRDLQRLMEQICANPKAFEQNVNENIRRNGEPVWISWTNRIVQDEQGQVLEILSIGTDISEQRKVNEALRRSEEQFRLIMENLADLVALLDRDGRRLYNSPSYREILGEPKNLLGSLSFEQIHPEDQARVREAFEDTVRTGRGHRLEYRLMNQHGEPRHIESQGSVIRDAQGETAQVVVVSRDVTERRQAEMALRVLNQTLKLEVAERTSELQAALVRAEAADRIKSAFLATMSHELRTPLNSIIGFTGIVLQGLAGPLNPEQTKQLGMVRGSARHLLELINDVLDISKIEAGQLEVHSEPFDLCASVERVTALIIPFAEKKGVALIATVSGELKEIVSDRRRVEQILINLLNNALKFTDQGRITLTVETVADYQPSPEGLPRAAIRMRVTDTGIGI
ncbi:MAG: PAS domain S-box protein, partial [Akkermansiaceae bacterium]|nr:PAS domain S-box protein [Verrucomicrobiales bacterium]